MAALSTKRVVNLKKPGRYGDGDGLLLKITPGGAKSWLFRYERDGRERWMGLGPLHTIGLAEARELALVARKQLLNGIDPMRARNEARERAAAELSRHITFADAAQQYFDLHERKWKNAKHRAQFLSTLRQYAFPVLGPLPVDTIDTGAVLRAVEPIWFAKTETATRVRQRIEKVLAWAIVRGHRAAPNPAAWVGHLREALPGRGQIAKVEHHAALPYSELPTFIAELQTRAGFAARALEFTILNAARTGEVIGARWDEIDLQAKTWTIPAGRMKGSREHRVPLTDRAVELLQALPREGDFVFIGMRKGTALSNMAMATVLKRMGRTDITVHGFRSTFMDWAHDRTGYPKVVIDMALAHVVGDKVEAAYRRGDLFTKRKQLMDAWAEFCNTPQPTGEVVPLRGVS